MLQGFPVPFAELPDCRDGQFLTKFSGGTEAKNLGAGHKTVSGAHQETFRGTKCPIFQGAFHVKSTPKIRQY